MATKLQCEICGGKLIGKPGGVFECENCGTEYSTEWAKAKIQEISGTVKIEGTVEVTGKVQIEGGTVQVDTTANKDSLAKRAFLLLEDCNWAKANDLFEQVLTLDPEYADAYLGMALADLHLKSQQEVATIGADNHNTDETVRIRILDQGKKEISVIRTVREATGLGSIEAKRLIKDSSFFSATIQQAMNLKNAGAKIEYERGIFDPSLSVQTIEKNSSFIKYLRFAKPSESEKTKEYLAQAKQLAKDSDYQRAKSLMAENTYAGYREAAKLLRLLGDYPDARQCEALCTEQMDRIRAEKRKQASLVSSRITTRYNNVIALSANGTVLSVDQYFFSWITDLKDIVSISF